MAKPPTSAHGRAYSHLKKLESDRRSPEKTAALPPLSDSSVADAAYGRAKAIHRKQKLEGYGKENRLELTAAEQAMKEILHSTGWRFNTEHPIGNYIIDFYVHAYRLAIEVDGGYHGTEFQKVKDKKRDRWLVSRGYRVVRLKNDQVTGFPKKTLATLMASSEPRNPQMVFPRVLPSKTVHRKHILEVQTLIANILCGS